MPESEVKEKDSAKYCWSLETDCFTRVYGDEMRGYLEMKSMCNYPELVIIKKEESSDDNSKRRVPAVKKLMKQKMKKRKKKIM